MDLPSAGRGIQLSGRLEKIQEVALGRGAEARGCEGYRWMVDDTPVVMAAGNGDDLFVVCFF